MVVNNLPHVLCLLTTANDIFVPWSMYIVYFSVNADVGMDMFVTMKKSSEHNDDIISTYWPGHTLWKMEDSISMTEASIKYAKVSGNDNIDN